MVFNVTKATGPFNIPVSILKLLCVIIAKPLETIFNASFLSGVVPDSLKIANIIPVYKKDSRFTLSN
jgi:hypothetical protein